MSTYVKCRNNNIFRLKLCRSVFGRLMYELLPHLPAQIRTWIVTWRPEWILPPVVIIKRLKPKWEVEFEHENQIYDKLLPLQGKVIPVCYGKATYNKVPSMVLSDIGGTPLDAKHDIEWKALERKIVEAYRPVLELGVANADLKLDNVHLVGDRVMLLDWEQTESIEGDIDIGATCAAEAQSLGHWFAFRQRAIRNGL